MKHADFVHLHVHTQFSLLDGAIRLDRLFEKAKAMSMPAVAITDHGNLFGVVSFYQRAFKAGIKPIIGCEVYVAPRSRFDRESVGIGDSSRHLVLLARNYQGYKNLVKLASLGFLEGFYYRPRIDREILARHSEGLIGLSACLHGEIAQYIVRGERDAARAAALQYRDIFGDGNFYLEIMENGLPEQKTANEGLIALGKELSIPLVATNDCHYLNREDAEAHDVLLCIQTGKTVEDADRMKLGTDQFYFRSPAEMKELFHYCPEAVENTVRIAEKCNLQLDFDKIFLPHFTIESDLTLDEHLKGLAWRGWEIIKKESGFKPDTVERYEKRLAYELDVIKSMGFAGYFLIVADFVNYAKSRSIPVGPGRGSVAGSLVAYSLGITNIDPIRYGLFFERFLNPDRKEMPDIDTDFCIEGRNDIIRYVTEKYSADRVAQIITFGTMQARAVIRDVGRALNMSYSDVDRIAKLVPLGPNMTLDAAMKSEPRLEEEAKKNEKVHKLLSLSRRLEGLNRHSSTHAAGVVISDKPLMERVPLYKSQRNEIITQYPMNDLQSLGMIKFDFLGLKTLTVIRDTLRFIREGGGEDIDINRIPLDDRLTYQLLAKGETDGVFQLESSGMKRILIGLKPDCIEDVMALIALYRPGPLQMVPEFISRKQGQMEVSYEVPQLEDILKETYGVILYQEQVMQIASALAGYTMGEADTLRKAMSKKKVDQMEKERPKFLSGARKNRIPEQKAVRIFEQMETFGGYGFNKSHSAAYGIISYQTAYLKAHYPVEFMAALLTSEKNNRDKIIKYISDCREMGIAVLQPDINESLNDFRVIGNQIRFGLEAVKNVGAGAIEGIIAVREEGGSFSSLQDFCSRVDLRKINKRVIESLVKCGAFDAFGASRRHLMENYEKIIEKVQKRTKGGGSPSSGLFEMGGIPPASDEGRPAGEKTAPEWNSNELLAYEKETLGFYITSHPLSGLADRLQLVANTDSSFYAGRTDNGDDSGEGACVSDGDEHDHAVLRREGETVTFAGIVSGIREVLTKKKETMARVSLEDMKGSVQAIAFPEPYRKFGDLLRSEEPLLVKGILKVEQDGPKIRITEVVSLLQALEQPVNSVHFIVRNGSVTDSQISALKDLLRSHPGAAECYFHLLVEESETVIYLGKDMRTRISDEVKKGVDLILGPGAIRFM
ncbi:MAG: DNA polymerase III subunit alpha [Syntrophales bacterium]|nr:DNA polymerase III subunit alpha [Syntrophales bacterium]